MILKRQERRELKKLQSIIFDINGPNILNISTFLDKSIETIKNDICEHIFAHKIFGNQFFKVLTIKFT